MRQHLLIATVLSAALLAVSETAKAEVVFNDTMPFSFPFFNECTGEFVLVEGEFHRVISIVERKDGTFQVHNNLTARGFGVGFDSGAVYRWNDTVLDVTVNPPGVVYSETIDGHTRLIGLGDTPNERVVLTVDIEVDESGVLTSLAVMDVFCQGD